MLKGEKTADSGVTTKYLSPLGAWALAFGCSVGWGAFVMPGTVFLPNAGPLGAVIGLLIGAAVMLVIGVNYRTLMARYPDGGGSYTFAGKVLGSDHGFMCAWMLLLTYMAVIWANSTALSLIIRYLFGDIFCFGFSYEIAGYTVYLGEILLAVALVAVTALICLVSKRLAVWIQILFALLMFGGICVAFVAVLVHNGGFSGLEPAFSDKGAPVTLIWNILILAPWAYIGFESISHSAGEFRFHVKKSFPVIAAALVTGALSYCMLTMCAAMAVPDGFSDWSEYISALVTQTGIRGLPTFNAAREAMGDTGLTVLGIAALGGVATGMIGYFIALSRMLHKMADDKMMPAVLGRTNRKGIPYAAVIAIAAVSFVIPFFGRTAISWIVDVTTIGAAIVYTYTSITAFVVGKREHKVPNMIFGAVGAAISLIFLIYYLIPALWNHSGIAAPSYLILIIWSVLGMIIFYALLRKDHTRRFGKSEAVWIILSFLVLIVSTIWIQQSAEIQTEKVSSDLSSAIEKYDLDVGLSPNNEAVVGSERYIANRMDEFGNVLHTSIYVQSGVIACAIAIIFSIFTIIKKREKHIEAERLLAEQNSQSKSTFLSNMSHDLRTPMNAVIGYTALALKEDDLPEHLRDYLEKIEHSGHHLLSLINDILDMSRIESGKTDLEPEPTDLSALIESVHTIFSVQMEEKSLEFPIVCEITNRYVICDKNRLTRVLLNLVSNAYKFTPSGGKVLVSLNQETDGEDGMLNYRLVVADNGIGMSPEFAEHIFDAFERERTSTVSGIQGTGLGMSISKSLIELMGGTITVDTQQGKGTRFTVHLPLKEANEEEINSLLAAEIALKAEHDFTGKRVLVVDDNMINREIASTILEEEGFTVDTAENGRFAVDMIAQSEPGAYDAVLMDIQMPVMDGYEAARAIRSMQDDRSNIPIIALTANTFEEDRRRIIESGMDAHVIKPFTPEELLAVICEFIKDNGEE